jgi:hypothetical protein
MYEKPEIRMVGVACEAVQNTMTKADSSFSDGVPNRLTIPAYDADE